MIIIINAQIFKMKDFKKLRLNKKTVSVLSHNYVLSIKGGTGDSTDDILATADGGGSAPTGGNEDTNNGGGGGGQSGVSGAHCTRTCIFEVVCGR